MIGCTPGSTGLPSSDPVSIQALAGTLTIGGSTALQPLIERAAAKFQVRNPGVQVKVGDEGSAAGRMGVCQDKIDIGLSDIPLHEIEIVALDCGDAVSTAVAMQAFIVAANRTGPGQVQALDQDQLQAIFSGAVKDWSEVGGVRQQLVVVNRQRGSGTRQSMVNYLFNGYDEVVRGGAAPHKTNQEIADIVGSIPGAVSYLGLAYAAHPGLVTLGIQQPNGMVMPTTDVVAKLGWPIGGPGLAITKGQPNMLASAFLVYMMSSEFRSDSVWEQLGFVAPPNMSIGNATGQ